MYAKMKYALPSVSAALVILVAACSPAAAPKEDAIGVVEAPSSASTHSEAVVAPGVSKPSSGPQVGDKIGESDVNLEDLSENSLARQAVEAAERLADYEARGVTEIGWEDLMPEGEEERLAQMYQSQMAMLYSGIPIEEGSAADAMVQIGTFNTVPELSSTKIRIPGYTVPFEYSATAEIQEFLLVPYFGACIHAPPPPPNQTLFVMTDKPIKLKDLAQAVWIEGIIFTTTTETELADAAYTIKMTHIEAYEY